MKRFLYAVALAPLLLLTACPGNTNLTAPQALTDLNGALKALENSIPLIQASAPAALGGQDPAALIANIQKAEALIAGLGDASANPTPLLQAEGIFNTVLKGLSLAPLPPPFDLIVLAANVVAPEVEAYVNTIAPGAVPAPATAVGAPNTGIAGPPVVRLTIEDARQVLQVKPAPKR